MNNAREGVNYVRKKRCDALASACGGRRSVRNRCDFPSRSYNEGYKSRRLASASIPHPSVPLVDHNPQQEDATMHDCEKRQTTKHCDQRPQAVPLLEEIGADRKSTRLNSSHRTY